MQIGLNKSKHLINISCIFVLCISSMIFVIYGGDKTPLEMVIVKLVMFGIFIVSTFIVLWRVI